MKLVNRKNCDALESIICNVDTFNYKNYEKEVIKFLQTKGRRPQLKAITFSIRSFKKIVDEIVANCHHVEEVTLNFDVVKDQEVPFTLDVLKSLANLPALKKLDGECNMRQGFNRQVRCNALSDLFKALRATNPPCEVNFKVVKF